jgi:hypothetical protein
MSSSVSPAGPRSTATGGRISSSIVVATYGEAESASRNGSGLMIAGMMIGGSPAGRSRRRNTTRG